MPPAPKDVPTTPDFESPEWDTKDGQDMEAQDSLSHVLQHTLQLAHEHIQEAIFSRHVLESTVDTTIEAALCTIDTLFVARESEVAVAPTALMNSSWEPEPEPQPCSMDTWLRAAIPESTAVKPSYLMHEFLQTSTPAVPHPHSTESHALGRSSREVVQHSQSGAGAAPAPPAATATGHEKAARGGKSRGEGPMPRLMASKQLTPEQAAAEDRLREELEIRKAQLAVAAGLDAKDADTKAKLAVMARSLKGKDYSYDHQGRIVPVAAFNADSSLRLNAGADFRLQSPDSGADAPSRGPNGSKQEAAGSNKKMAPSSRPIQASKAPAERKLVNDYREAPSRSQPNALEVMNVNSGVTLRQGPQTKPGPQRTNSTTSMTREEFLRYARERTAAQSPSPTAHEAHARPTQPVCFPPITTATAPNTARNSTAGNASAFSRQQEGLGGSTVTSSAAHEFDFSSANLSQPHSQQQHPQHQPVHLPPLPSAKGSSVTAAEGGRGNEASAGDAGTAWSSSPRDPTTSTTRFDPASMRASKDGGHQRTGDLRRVSGLGASAADRGPARPTSANSSQAHSQGIQPTGASVTPLSAYPDSPPRTLNAKVKPKAPLPLPKPSTPDTNAWIVGASDWGTSSGSPTERGITAALDVSKPSTKKLESEVGRSLRLPRDRTSQATLASPVSSLKMGALQQESLPRSMKFAA